jgi:YegS/Rv2252/BmrU family lipid kinase
VELVLVANPASGSTTDVDGLADALRARGARVRAFDVHDLEAVEAGLDGAERLVVAGGDGSIGPTAALAARAGLPLAVVPTGTANDFARALGLPRERDAALALATAPAPGRRRVEVLRAGDRPFVNAASAGLSVIAAHAARPLKPSLGVLAYAVGALRAGLTAAPLAAEVRADGEVAWAGLAWQIVLGGTGAFGGGSSIGGTDPRDGLVDVAVVLASPRAALARRALAMRAGRLHREDGVVHLRAHEIHLALPAGTRFNVDGELCDVEPSHFRADPKGVEVLVP